MIQYSFNNIYSQERDGSPCGNRSRRNSRLIIHKNKLVIPKVEFSTASFGEPPYIFGANWVWWICMSNFGDKITRLRWWLSLYSVVSCFLLPFGRDSVKAFGQHADAGVHLILSRGCFTLRHTGQCLLRSVFPLFISLGRECSTANGNEWGDISLWTLETGRGFPGACRREACRWGQKQINY